MSDEEPRYLDISYKVLSKYLVELKIDKELWSSKWQRTSCGLNLVRQAECNIFFAEKTCAYQLMLSVFITNVKIVVFQVHNSIKNYISF